MSAHSKRCPNCLRSMPLVRRRCPYCRTELPVGEDTLSLEGLFLQERMAGRFEIVSTCSQTQNSAVYVANDLILERQVIIKVIQFPESTPPPVLIKWEQNARRDIRLDHPNIVRNYTFGHIGTLYYFISEFCGHPFLDQLLQSRQKLPIHIALVIIQSVARAAQAAHDLGIAHHRLKPRNITAPVDGYCQVLDFASSRGTINAIAMRPWAPGVEDPTYLAPEQIETGISDTASDQYAIGIILFEMLTGSLPFTQSGENGALQRLAGPPPHISSVNPLIPREIEVIWQRLMRINPAERYESCRDFVRAIESLDPELWAADANERATNHTDSLGQLLSSARKCEKNRDFRKAILLCERALILSPYDVAVTDLLARLQKNLERSMDVRTLINKGISAFYEHRLENALTVLNRARQMDKDNPEVIRLTHEILQEQERARLVSVLLETANLDVTQKALTQAMAKVVRILEIDPSNKHAHQLKAQIEAGIEEKATGSVMVSQAELAFKDSRIDDALEILDRVMKCDPSNPAAIGLYNQIVDWERSEQISGLKNLFEKQVQSDSYREAIDTVNRIRKLDESLAFKLLKQIDSLRTQEAHACDTPSPTFHEVAQACPNTEPSLEHVTEIPDELSHDSLLPISDRLDRFEDCHSAQLSKPAQTRSWWVTSTIILGILLFSSFAWIISEGIDNRKQESTAFLPPTALIDITETPSPTALPTNTPTPIPTETVILTQSPAMNSDALLDLAGRLMEEKRFSEAKTIYDEILKTNRRSVRALDGLKRAERELGSFIAKRNATVTPKSTKGLTARIKSPTPTPYPVLTIPPSTSTPSPTITAQPTTRSTGSGIWIARIMFSPEPPIAKRGIRLTASIESQKGESVGSGTLYYRFGDDERYQQQKAKVQSDQLRFEIPATEVKTTPLWYYITFTDSDDKSGNYGASTDPYRKTIEQNAIQP